MKRLSIATMMLLATTSLVWAQAPAAGDDPHHPPQSGTVTEPAQPVAPPAQTGAGGMPAMMNMPLMMNMMSGNMPMNMTGMMQMMGAMQQDGMTMIDHVEGRIAFLRVEIKITDAQTAAWNAFAEALRANAKRLGDARASMMVRMGVRTGAAPSAPTLADRLDLQEQWHTARIDGIRAIRSSLTGLYAVLSEDQKKVADDLLVPHMGMGPGTGMGPGMGMMPGMPGPMQPGAMRPGAMQPGPGQK